MNDEKERKMTEKRMANDREIIAANGAIFTVGELKKFLNKEKLKPSELFDKYDLLEDPAIKETIEEEVGFELEYRDKQAEDELNEEMRKEIDNEEDFDLGLPGQQPSSEPQPKKKPEKEQKPLEGDEDDLLPAGDGDSSDDGSPSHSEDDDPLMPD